MKRTGTIILTIATVLLWILPSCTHNNGDIGPVFGNWKLVRTQMSGETEMKIDHPMFWSFQNTTFRCIYKDSEPEGSTTYGNFRIDDNTLFLDFPDENYPPPAALHLPSHSEWQILKLTHGELTVRYDRTPDSSAILYFKKW